MRRRAYRAASRVLSRFSYGGGSTDRLRSGWIPGGGSADSDLLFDLPKLRERSRDLVRNDPHAAGLAITHGANVVGTGILPQCRIDGDSLGLSAEMVEDLQRAAEAEFWEWSSCADASGKLDFAELQLLIDSQMFENGEVFLLRRMIERPHKRYAFCWQVIEADRVDSPIGMKSDKTIRSGIRLDENGEPVEYYIRKTHPGDIILGEVTTPFEYQAVPARDEFGNLNVLHLYNTRRPGQSRGVPFMAPALEIFKDLASYIEAEVIAARVAACFAVFVKTSDPERMGAARSTSMNSSGQRLEALEPGIIEYLSENEDITTANPGRPNVNFDPFVERILRAIGVSLGLPYELVAKDFSKTNYSSARASLLEGWRYFTMRRDWLARKFCQPTWDFVQEESFLRGYVDYGDFYGNRRLMNGVRWIGAKRGWIDPVKEIDASTKSMAAGISTLSDEAAAQGGDWEENLEQLAREKLKRQELGLPEPGEVPAKKSSPADQAVDEDADDGQAND